jgi:D,D-heptose 1,7-bisphosphate phosphatase
MNAAIFLDRDNTLIYSDTDVTDPSQVRLLQGVPSAIASLRGLGYRIIVATNQDGIANGRYTEAATDAVHMKINEQIGNISGTSIDRFYYCPFHPDAILERYRKDHPWRKPNPGMIVQAGKDMDIDLSASWLISTDKNDVKTAYAAGVRMLLLTSEAVDMIPLKMEEIFINQTRALAAKESDGPYFTARNLVEAVRVIAQQRRPDFPEERVVRDRFGRKVEAGGQKPKPQFQAEAPAPLFTVTHVEQAAPQVVEPAPAPEPIPQSSPQPVVIEATTPAPSPVEPPPPVRAPDPEPMLIPTATAPGLSDDQEEADDAQPLEIKTATAPESVLQQEEPQLAQVPAPQVSRPKIPSQPAAPESPSETDQPLDDVPAIEKLPPMEIQLQRMESSLRQILQEIRSSREVVTEMSFTTIIGLILQALAVILMAGALFQPNDNFIRWVMCAIVLQMASITAILIKR